MTVTASPPTNCTSPSPTMAPASSLNRRISTRSTPLDSVVKPSLASPLSPRSPSLQQSMALTRATPSLIASVKDRVAEFALEREGQPSSCVTFSETYQADFDFSARRRSNLPEPEILCVVTPSVALKLPLRFHLMAERRFSPTRPATHVPSWPPCIAPLLQKRWPRSTPPSLTAAAHMAGLPSPDPGAAAVNTSPCSSMAAG
jgi:hypothetical protein